MYTLTSEDRRSLQSALAEKFNRAELAQLVTLGLGLNLDHIAASDQTLLAIAFEVIGWAERRDELGTLVRCALEARPKSATLQSLAEKFDAEAIRIGAPDSDSDKQDTTSFGRGPIFITQGDKGTITNFHGPITQGANGEIVLGNKIVNNIRSTPDDLSTIAGIEPATATLLAAHGMGTFGALAATPVERLRSILDDAGVDYLAADLSTWPQQAALAALGDTAGLAKLQAALRTKP